MTVAVFYLSGSRYNGFDIKGHSGYSTEGSDIICAAISAMTSLTVTCLEGAGNKCVFRSDDSIPAVFLKLGHSDDYSQSLLSALYSEISSLAAEYPQFVKTEQVHAG